MQLIAFNVINNKKQYRLQQYNNYVFVHSNNASTDQKQSIAII